MNKICLHLLCFSSLFFCFPGLLNAQEYCAAWGSNVNYEWIQRVTVNELDHTSQASFYSNNTDRSATLTQGDEAVIELQPGFRWGAYAESWRVFIDYNRDGDFYDAGETVFATPYAQSTAVVGNFVVPDDVEAGETRMRVVMRWGGSPPACGSFTYGEVEDYTVYLAPLGGEGEGEGEKRTSIIDIVVFHTQAAADDAIADETNIDEKIDEAIEEANEVFANSHLKVRLRRVGGSQLLSDFTAEGPPTDIIDVFANTLSVQYEKLNELQADLVSLIIGSGTDSQGTSFQRLRGEAHERINEDPAVHAVWSVVRYSGLDKLSFAHEVGHNLGATHEEEDVLTRDEYDLLYPTARAHYVDGLFSTLMSTRAYCEESCVRRPVFSNPDLQYSFDGEESSCGTQAANNASVVREVAPEVENYRSSLQNSENAFDVNGDSCITPLDVLRILNSVNDNGYLHVNDLPEGFNADGNLFVDVSGDSLLTPLDALLAINHLNEKGSYCYNR